MLKKFWLPAANPLSATYAPSATLHASGMDPSSVAFGVAADGPDCHDWYIAWKSPLPESSSGALPTETSMSLSASSPPENILDAGAAETVTCAPASPDQPRRTHDPSPRVLAESTRASTPSGTDSTAETFQYVTGEA